MSDHAAITRLPEPPTDRGGESESLSCLAVLLGSGRSDVAELKIHGPRTRLGNSGQCDIVLLDEGVAPIHAELILQEGIWTLADLGGEEAECWVDGQRVTGTRLVVPGSELRLGQARFVFDSTDLWEDSAPRPAAAQETLAASLLYPDEHLAPETDPSARSGFWWLWYLVGAVVVIVGAVILILRFR